MCDPLTIAGIALTAGSEVANGIAASKVAHARDDALAAERTRQSKLNQEANSVNAQSQDRYVDFSGKQDQAATDLGQYFTDQKIANANDNATATNALTIPQSGSNVVTREVAKQNAKADAYANQQGEALGKLRSFGDVLGDIGRQQARDAGTIGQIGGFKAGSENVLPLELDAASHKGDGLKTFGDILGLGGSLLTGAGLTGGGPGVVSFTGDVPGVPAGFDPWAGMRSVTAGSNLFSPYARSL
jgi:hypothetical protein